MKLNRRQLRRLILKEMKMAVTQSDYNDLLKIQNNAYNSVANNRDVRPVFEPLFVLTGAALKQAYGKLQGDPDLRIKTFERTDNLFVEAWAGRDLRTVAYYAATDPKNKPLPLKELKDFATNLSKSKIAKTLGLDVFANEYYKWWVSTSQTVHQQIRDQLKKGEIDDNKAWEGSISGFRFTDNPMYKAYKNFGYNLTQRSSFN